MTQLFAYLFVRKQDGSWEVGSYRNLEGILSAWKEASKALATGIVHVGFWRPNADDFESAAAANPGVVLLTETARGSLPKTFQSASSPCAVVNGQPLFEALSGWGYEKTDGNQPPEISEPPEATPLTEWLSAIDTEDSEIASIVRKWGISNEATYRDREHHLPAQSRESLAAYRFKKLSGSELASDTILDQIQFAPPWILRLGIKALNLSIRPLNRLGAKGIHSVEGLIPLGANGLIRMEGLGLKSVREIGDAIFGAYEKGAVFCDANAHEQSSLLPLPISDSIEYQGLPLPRQSSPPSPGSFSDAVVEAFGLLKDNEIDVLRLRMGFDGSKQTLESVGQEFSLTRERIRQIETKATRRIALMSCWTKQMKVGLEAMLIDREDPLPLVGLDVLNAWFTGIGDLETPFEYSLKYFFDAQEFYVLKINGQKYVSKINQDEWVETVRKAKTLLSSLSKREEAPSEIEARCLVDSLLATHGKELRSLLWLEASRWARFTTNSLGEKILASFGMGAESVVEAILSESETPLHYTEIARLSSEKGKAIDIRRALQAAANVGLLLARGVYGLDRHIQLSNEERRLVLSEVEDLLSESGDRQWHAAEICEELGARGLDFEGRLSKYALDVILRESKTLSSLGRMVWAASSDSILGTADRINVWQAAVSMLQQHGRPMSTQELREKISKARGLGATFQIHQADPVIQVGEGLWGILWRDVPFAESDAEKIVSEMEKVIRAKSSGLHTSEIVAALTETSSIAAKVKDPRLLVALGQRSGRLKSGRGGYVYLPEWEGPRRLTAYEAIEEAFKGMQPAGGTTIQVAKRASGLLGREIPLANTAPVLMSIGAIYDSSVGLWTRHADEIDVDNEIESASDIAHSEARNTPQNSRVSAISLTSEPKDSGGEWES